MKTIGERILYIREHVSTKKMSMQTFADRIGTSPASVNQWEKGNTMPPKTVIKIICDEFGISQDWLIDGIGDMMHPKDELDEIADITAALFKDADPMRRQLAKLVFALDTEEIKAVKSIWDKMLTIDTKKEP